MDVVEALVERNHRPVDDVADVRVRGDEAPGRRVGLVRGERVLDRLRDRVLVDVVILPDVAFGVQHRHFPVQVVARLVVLHVDHLAARAVVHLSAIGGHDVDPVVEICGAGAAAIVLVRLDRVPQRERDVERPGVRGVRGGVHPRRLGHFRGLPAGRGLRVARGQAQVARFVGRFDGFEPLHLLRAGVGRHGWRRGRRIDRADRPNWIGRWRRPFVQGRSGQTASHAEAKKDDERKQNGRQRALRRGQGLFGAVMLVHSDASPCG